MPKKSCVELQRIFSFLSKKIIGRLSHHDYATGVSLRVFVQPTSAKSGSKSPGAILVASNDLAELMI